MVAIVRVVFLEVCPVLKHANAMAESILWFILILNPTLQVTWPEAFLLVTKKILILVFACSI